jgi:zeta-carotene isomerase
MFAVWNGDRRLKAKFGKKAEVFIDQTSVIPFAAIISGKQKLPKNYLSEFIRVPYVTIVTAVFGSYFSHKAMIEGSSSLKW